MPGLFGSPSIGAGYANARPLLWHATHCIAFDAAEAVVQWGATVAPGAVFLAAHAEALPVSPQFYLDYIMTGTNISHAVSQGAVESEIRDWCRQSLEPVFGCRDREVLFRGYFICLLK